jgi:hypothetical protein
MENEYIPSFIQWQFGDYPYSSPAEAKSSAFSFSFRPSMEDRPYSFKQEFPELKNLAVKRTVWENSREENLFIRKWLS